MIPDTTTRTCHAISWVSFPDEDAERLDELNIADDEIAWQPARRRKTISSTPT